MSHSQDALASQARHLVDALAEQGELHATGADLALGVVQYLGLDAPEQARAIAFCWWGLDLKTLALLVESGRWDTVEALYRPPSPEPRKRDRHYAAAARELGKTPKAIRDGVQRGLRSLLAWQLVRATRGRQGPT